MEFQELRSTFERTMDAFKRLEWVALPVVAAVRGLCFGGGLEMALRTDVIFAGSSAKFGHPEQSTWEAMGALGADELTVDVAMPLFDTEDVRKALPAAVDAFPAGEPRPQFDFQGR